MATKQTNTTVKLASFGLKSNVQGLLITQSGAKNVKPLERNSKGEGAKN